MILAFCSSPTDSAVLSDARKKLSVHDTLGAIDLLADWSDRHGESFAVSGLLDRLQLPDESSVATPSTTEAGVSAPSPWSILVEGDGHMDSNSPIQGAFNLQRNFFLDDSGRNTIAAGATVGSWTEDADPYATADAWLGWNLRHPTWSTQMAGWAGWTEENQLELGASGQLRQVSKHGAWRISHGPSARFSWRKTRRAGWALDVDGAAGENRLDLDGALWLRQDPPWPTVQDTLNTVVPWRLARVRVQSSLDADLLLPHGSLSFGPGFDLDARASLSRDRWSSSSTAVHHTLRAEMAGTAKIIARWSPSKARFAQLDVGWTWSATSGEALPDMSPYDDGLNAGLRYLSDF